MGKTLRKEGFVTKVKNENDNVIFQILRDLPKDYESLFAKKGRTNNCFAIVQMLSTSLQQTRT